MLIDEGAAADGGGGGMTLDPTPKLDEEGRGYRVPNGGVYSTLGDLASCEYTSRGYYYIIYTQEEGPLPHMTL